MYVSLSAAIASDSGSDFLHKLKMHEICCSTRTIFGVSIIILYYDVIWFKQHSNRVEHLNQTVMYEMWQDYDLTARPELNS